MSVEVHTEQARKIVQTVLDKLDTNGDGVLTMREFLAGGIAGLPHFQGIENLGHHYDAEGEYFLHHEEKYHNTPETSREEDYIHPEGALNLVVSEGRVWVSNGVVGTDIEHFLAHEKIEKEEEERMAEFVGDDPVALGQEDEPTLAGDAAIRAAVDDDASAKIWDAETLQQFEKLLAESPKKAADYIAQRKQQVFGIDRDAAATAASTTSEADSTNDEEKKRKERAEFARAQAAKFSKTSREARQRGEWGSQGDMKRPKDDADRLRRAVPYKYRACPGP